MRKSKLEHKKRKKKISPSQNILEQKKKKAIRNRSIGMLAIQLLVTSFSVLLLFGLVGGLTIVKGSSMHPTYEDGDLILFFRLGSVQRGDVVILHNDEEDIHLIKRVIAREGDVVDIDDETGTLTVNGEPQTESYVFTKTYRTGTEVEYPLRLQSGEIFVMGDNREASTDSRSFGPVQKSDIVGKVLASIRWK